jgi:hypothetical protein
MNTSTLSKLFTSLALLAGMAVAHAQPVEFDFTGTIVDDPFGLLTTDTSFSGKYTFDDDAPNLSSDPQVGAYLSVGPDFIFDAIVGGVEYAADGETVIGVAHDVIDQYTPVANDGSLTLELFLQANSGTVFKDVSLPSSPPQLADFDVAQFLLVGDGVAFVGALDTLTCATCSGETPPLTTVPTPSTLSLIGAGLLAFGYWHRRQRFNLKK